MIDRLDALYPRLPKASGVIRLFEVDQAFRVLSAIFFNAFIAASAAATSA